MVGLWGCNLTYAKSPQSLLSAVSKHVTPTTQQPATVIHGDILILSPEDKHITYEKKLRIAGIILNKKIKTIYCNNEKIPIYNQKFLKTIPLNLGKNFIQIEYQQDTNPKQTIVRRVLYLSTFTDIRTHDGTKRNIEELTTLGILNAYSNGQFNPQKMVERAELAATLSKIRHKNLPDVTSNMTEDVPAQFWAAPYIKSAIEDGYMSVSSDQLFKPYQFITKAETRIILSKFNNTPDKEVFPTNQPNTVRSSIVPNPNDLLTRSELAVMLSKLPIISAQIDDLYHWDQYQISPASYQMGYTPTASISVNRPKIDAITFSPPMLPADSKTMGKIFVTVSHSDGLDKIVRVAIPAKYFGWGENSQIFLYDDGKSYGDLKKNDGIFSADFLILETISPGQIQFPVTVEDINGQTVSQNIKLKVVSNINGLY